MRHLSAGFILLSGFILGQIIFKYHGLNGQTFLLLLTSVGFFTIGKILGREAADHQVGGIPKNG